MHALRAEAREVRALVRTPERGARLAGLGVELAAGDVTDAASVYAAAEGCTHVVHLVAIIRGRPADFQRVMVDGFRTVLSAAKRGRRLAGRPDERARHRAKTRKTSSPTSRRSGRWSAIVIESGLEHVIFRPSFVFGRDGGALPTFIRQVKLSPVVTVIGNGASALRADLDR